MSDQGKAEKLRRATHRGRRGRRPASADLGIGGPIRPKTKKPPPQPSGEFCGFGICCHFGIDCVNSHTAGEIEFFKKRAELRLQLREMALQVEGKKVEYERQKVVARQPLQPVINASSNASTRSQSRPPTQAQAPTQPPQQPPAPPPGAPPPSHQPPPARAQQNKPAAAAVCAAQVEKDAWASTSVHRGSLLSQGAPRRIRPVPRPGAHGIGFRSSPRFDDLTQKTSFDHMVPNGSVVPCGVTLTGYDGIPYVTVLDKQGYHKFIPLKDPGGHPTVEFVRDDD